MMRMVPPEVGKPIGAINGDLFEVVPAYMGDPMGLHISNGELISSPIPSHSCFWMDAAGQLFLTNVAPRFQVTWPDGRSLGFGLNEARGRDEAVLYTAAVGASTRANGGRELVLERVGTEPWLPLRPGATLQARVREVRNGDSPLNRDVMVLSIGPALALAGRRHHQRHRPENLHRHLPQPDRRPHRHERRPRLGAITARPRSGPPSRCGIHAPPWAGMRPTCSSWWSMAANGPRSA